MSVLALAAFAVLDFPGSALDVTVTLTGFKVYVQKGLVLTATERLSLPPISLVLGGREETISVEASSVRVQTQSGERSAVISAAEIETIGLRGRDFMGTLKFLPGKIVIPEGTEDFPNAEDRKSTRLNSSH